MPYRAAAGPGNCPCSPSPPQTFVILPSIYLKYQKQVFKCANEKLLLLVSSGEIFVEAEATAESQPCCELWQDAGQAELADTSRVPPNPAQTLDLQRPFVLSTTH